MLSPTVKRRVKKILLWMEITLILLLGAGMGLVLGAIYQMNKTLPPDSALDTYRAPVGTTFLSSDGEVLAKLAAEYREPVSLEKIPKHMQQAMVAIEDGRFYSHSGVDFRGLARALWANLTGRELAQGGSTITQQLAKNIFLSSKKTLSRKIKEILLAVQIERNWTKSRILEAYLNQVYFGSGAYGINAAAKTYFGKPVQKLTLAEAAMLAGLPQRPSELSPYVGLRTEGTTKRTKARRNDVIDRMLFLKFITPEQAAKAKAAPINVIKERPRSVGFFKAKYFCQHVLDEMHNELKYDDDVIDKAGLTVVTTLNWKMQQAAEKAAKDARSRIRRSGATEASLICVDPHTGYIRAMVGGVNEPWEKYQFNCATQARRQPGSAFKTFVYAAAMERGDSPYSSVNASAAIPMPDGTVYTPQNHGKYQGYMSYMSAFAGSVNGAAVNVCVKVGPERVKALAQRLGLTGDIRAYPSMALGTSEATPLEMASAFGVFAAKGKRAVPMAILQVRDQDNHVVADNRPRVIDTGLKASTIAGMDQLMRAVVTGGTARVASGVPRAHGKTGTTERSTDVWFVGYTPDLATAVWCGNRNNKPMGYGYGGTVAAPIWAQFMKQAVELNPAKKKPLALAKLAPPQERPRERPRRPRSTVPHNADGNLQNLIRVSVCAESGLLATEHCPSAQGQEFMLGEQPLSRCTTHDGTRPSKEKKEKKKDGEKPGDRKEDEKKPGTPAGERPTEPPAATAGPDKT